MRAVRALATYPAIPGSQKPLKKSSRATTSNSTGKIPIGSVMPDFYEFFAGGGMARRGARRRVDVPVRKRLRSQKGPFLSSQLGDRRRAHGWRCSKGHARANLPGCADLVWGSFPVSGFVFGRGRRRPQRGAVGNFLSVLGRDRRTDRRTIAPRRLSRSRMFAARSPRMAGRISGRSARPSPRRDTDMAL